ncbi:ABC transporter substrate-binding protein [Hahella sp. HN01]|uniref:substrate-binding periplasmic protein n=1 Tax=Hahella sp. HN01 TaxID=2847262 RepID=UPI001C1E9205|nr:ABC transporter substrate-binding protein [Hahella sp. HN01]MBU6954371.1 transporter substrate-binding domain-containing protein [Hahella sp. HN01]
MKRLILSVLTVFIAAVGLEVRAEGKNVQLTSLDWPPYTSEGLANQGASAAVAKEAFAAMGYTLEVKFYPWKRAVALAKNDPAYDGYFPEYYAKELEDDFILSEPMGSGPLGFAQRKNHQIDWSALPDLAKYRIGVVSGYVNTAEFDDMVANKQLNASEAGDDVKNLMKLVSDRIDLAVVDKNVMKYLLSTEASLKSAAGAIEFNPTLLEDKKLYICFKKGPRGEELAKVFSEGLKKIDVDKIMQGYF